MKFKEIQEGRLYKNKDYTNVYTKYNGLLYHVGNIYGEYRTPDRLHLDMYYVEYSPIFILDMEFEEIWLVNHND